MQRPDVNGPKRITRAGECSTPAPRIKYGGMAGDWFCKPTGMDHAEAA
jgi:hypothetical protein